MRDPQSVPPPSLRSRPALAKEEYLGTKSEKLKKHENRKKSVDIVSDDDKNTIFTKKEKFEDIASPAISGLLEDDYVESPPELPFHEALFSPRNWHWDGIIQGFRNAGLKYELVLRDKGN